MKKFVIVDLYCGAGGASHSAVRAVKDLHGEILHFIAVNHWNSAVATHKSNHPFATHYQETVANVKPREAVPGGRVHLLLAGPECTYHSKAAGDRPINDQSRIAAWSVLNWLQDLYVDTFIIENVPDFLEWGPLNADGKRNKKLKGVTFQAYIEAIKALGYNVEYRVLCAADYGDPTSRERLFIMGKRQAKGQITWPEPTHAKPDKIEALKKQPGLFAPNLILQPHRPVREVIDWKLKGESVFNRKRPLSPNTMKRIYSGLFKFGLKDFVIGQQSAASPRSVNDPAPTVATAGAISLIQPAIIQFNNNCDASSIDDPLRTQVTGNHFGLAEYIVGSGGPEGKGSPQSVDSPIRTLLTQNHSALIEPFLIGAGGPEGQRRPFDINEPLKTQTRTQVYALAESFILSIRGGNDGYTRAVPMSAPMPTITTDAPIALIVPVSHGGGENRVYPTNQPIKTLTTAHNVGLAEYIITTDQIGSRSPAIRSVDELMPTISTKNRMALLQPYIVSYYSTGQPISVDDPLDTVTTKPRFGLCVPIFDLDAKIASGHLLIDILFRMLQPHELAAAMSFPRHYNFVSATPPRKRKTKYALPDTFSRITSDEAVRMIGNAWPGETGYALSRAHLEGLL